MSFHLRIGSRPSALALAQANLVKAQIETALPAVTTEIVAVSTSGDRLTAASLARIDLRRKTVCSRRRPGRRRFKLDRLVEQHAVCLSRVPVQFHSLTATRHV